MGIRDDRVRKLLSETLLGKTELRGSEVQSLAGVAPEDARRLWQALGFPAVPADQALFTPRDAEALRIAANLAGNTGENRDAMLQMARATGQALSRVAHMHVRTIANEIEEATRTRGISDSEAADRIAAAAESLVRGYEPFLGYIWRRHLLAAISQVVAGEAEESVEGERSAIGFADLVDFTATSQQLTEQELANLVDRFERIVYQEVPERGGRVIKTLGDEVMFSNSNLHAAAQTALALADACRNDEIVSDVRVGMAVGSMLAWEGDLYGPTVNLAHRLAGVARPGTVIVSDEFALRLQDDDAFLLVEIRDVKLKGIGRTKLWVLRHFADPHG